MHYDLYSKFAAVLAVAPVVATGGINGIAINVKEGNGVLFVVETGALVGSAIYGAKLQESDDGTNWADVAAARVQSNAPAQLAASSAYRLGYAGRKPWVRVQLFYTSGTSLAVAAVAIIRPLSRPVP